MVMTQPEWDGPVEAHPLDSARGKVIRAVQHATYLTHQCAAFSAANPLRFVDRFHPHEDRHLIFVEGRRPPLYLGMILGEVVHDLRSAVDHLAWQLALQQSGEEALSKRGVAMAIQFPIRDSREEFDRHRALPYFSAKAVERIESFQPYHDNPDVLSPLAVVRDLSNTDKHQALTPSAGQLSIAHMVLRGPSMIPGDRVEVLQPTDTIADTERPVLGIRMPPEARIEIDGPPITAGFFVAKATGDVRFVLPETIEEISRMIVRVVDAFEDLFPSVDWSERKISWVTPGAPRPDWWGTA